MFSLFVFIDITREITTIISIKGTWRVFFSLDQLNLVCEKFCDDPDEEELFLK